MPAQELVYRILLIKGGSMMDKELYEAVSSATDLSYSDFLKTLMKLELNGLVKVSSIKEDQLLIELIKERADQNWE
ncbi:MAG: hypothetical protein ACP5LZ_05560 [Fervidicoccaceae archaeon]|jgi:hypothetical protein|nr:MAG: hypothetical protein C0179_02385 [Fervidicoccus sp.]